MSINLHNAEFVKSAADGRSFICDELPKVAFAGRSNVGKSSTINALLNRNRLARVSENPGKTAHVNYYLIDGAAYLVDLPGYGFAKVSKTERERWGHMMEEYFNDRANNLKLCVLIVDARHKPTADDRRMCDYFRQCGYPFMVIANKADKLKKSEIEAQRGVISEALTLDPSEPPVFYSAYKKSDLESILERVQNAWAG